MGLMSSLITKITNKIISVQPLKLPSLIEKLPNDKLRFSGLIFYLEYSYNSGKLFEAKEFEIYKQFKEYNELIDLGFDPKDFNTKELFEKFDLLKRFIRCGNDSNPVENENFRDYLSL